MFLFTYYRHDHNTSNRIFLPDNRILLKFVNNSASRESNKQYWLLKNNPMFFFNNNWIHASDFVLYVWPLIIIQCTLLTIRLCSCSVFIRSINYCFNLAHFYVLQYLTPRFMILNYFLSIPLDDKDQIVESTNWHHKSHDASTHNRNWQKRVTPSILPCVTAFQILWGLIITLSTVYRDRYYCPL